MSKPKLPSNVFCILPWVGLELRTQGTMAICCNSANALTNTRGEELNAHQHSPAEALTSPERKRLQKSFMNGIADVNCARCWKLERSGDISRRQIANNEFKKEIQEIDFKQPSISMPKSLDLKFSNYCNQKCRICGPGSSTLWGQEALAMHKKNPETVIFNWGKRLVATMPAEAIAPVYTWGKNNLELWTQLSEWLPSLTRLDLFGGEPFLIPECEKILLLAIELGVSKKITVRLSSNASIFPEKYIADIFPHFKKVLVFLSIDGVEKQFEYQRHPANWKNAFDVYKKFKATEYFSGLLLSISAFNIYDLPDYLHFWQAHNEHNIQLSPIFSPHFQNINILPSDLKQKVAKRLFEASAIHSSHETALLNIMMYMCEENREEFWPLFVQSTYSHDGFRKEDFRKVFPEYYAAGKELFTAAGMPNH